MSLFNVNFHLLILSLLVIEPFHTYKIKCTRLGVFSAMELRLFTYTPFPPIYTLFRSPTIKPSADANFRMSILWSHLSSNWFKMYPLKKKKITQKAQHDKMCPKNIQRENACKVNCSVFFESKMNI